MSKHVLRREVREAVRALPAAVRAREADAIVRQVAAVLPAGPVLAYVPLPDEVDISALLTMLAAERRLALPRVHHDHLVAHWVLEPQELALGSLGVREPHADGDPVDPAELAAILVPGRAFDRQGGRLGRGKGYYDRFLPLAPQALRIGLAHGAHVVAAIPMEPHDVPVDVVVAPDAVIVTGARDRRPGAP